MGAWGPELLANDQAMDFIDKLEKGGGRFWRECTPRQVLMAAIEYDNWPDFPTPYALLGAAKFLLERGCDLRSECDLIGPFISWELTEHRLVSWRPVLRTKRKKELKYLLSRITGPSSGIDPWQSSDRPEKKD